MAEIDISDEGRMKEAIKQIKTWQGGQGEGA